MEQNLVALEEQLYATLDVAERHRLLQAFIKDLDKRAHDLGFDATIATHIAELDERYTRQKEFVQRLKLEGADTTDGYFLLVTLKAMHALCAYRYALARKIVIHTVTQKPN